MKMVKNNTGSKWILREVHGVFSAIPEKLLMERAPNNYSEWYTHLLVDLNSEILIQNQLYLSTVNYYIYRLYFPPLMCLRLHFKSPSQKYYLKNKTNKLCLPGRTLKKRNRDYPWGKEQHGWRTERKDLPLDIFVYLLNVVQCECITYFLKPA